MIASGPSNGRAVPEWAPVAISKAQRSVGTFHVLVGGSSPERGHVLRAVRSAAEVVGVPSYGLQGELMDRHVPYGIVQDLISLLKPDVKPEEGLASPLAGLMALVALSQRGPQSSPAPGPPPRRRLPSPRASSLSSENLPRAEEVRAEVLELFRERVTQGPVVLTLEAGEYVDSPSLSFFSQLAREVPQLPVVVVVSLREEDTEAYDSWKKALPPSSSIAFSKVDEGTALASQVRGVRRRLEALPASSRRAVAAVGAAGPDATLPLLQLVISEPADQVEKELEPALAAGVLWREGDRFLVYEPGWRPELERLVAASELRALHAALARGLRATHPAASGKVLFRIAEHWTESGVVDEAAPAVLAASLEAIQRGAHEEAERGLHRALVLAQAIPGDEGRELEERALAELGIAQEMLGQSREAVESLDRAIRTARARRTGVDRWGPYLSKYARIVTADFALDASVEARLHEALEEAERQKMPSVEAELHSTFAHRFLIRGQLDEGRKHAALALERAEVQKDPPVLARALRMMALSLFTGSVDPKELAEARHLLKRTIDTIPADRAGQELAFAYDDIASVACTAHDEAQALTYGKRSVALARQHCSRSDLLLMLGNFCEHQLHAKDLEGATASLKEIRVFADRYALPEGHSVHQQWMLSEALRMNLAGDAVGSRRMLEETFALGEKLGARDLMGQALVYLAVQSVERRDYDAARTYARRIEREGLKRALYSMTRELLDEAVRKIPAKGP